MARGMKARLKKSPSASRTITGGPKLAGPVENFGVVGTGIVGGANTTQRNSLPGGRPRNARPGTLLGAKTLRGRGRR